MKQRLFFEQLPQFQEKLSNQAGYDLFHTKVKYSTKNFKFFLGLRRVNPANLGNFRDKINSDLSLQAASNGNIELYDYLISLPGFDKNTADDQGINALQRSAISGHPEMFDHLVKKYGFDPKRKFGHFSMLDFMIYNAPKNMLDHFLSNYISPVDDQSLENAKNSKNRNAEPYIKNILNLNLQLSAAIADKDLEHFKMLCEKQGAKPKTHSSNLAEFAAVNNAIDIFKYLVTEHNFHELDSKYLTEWALFGNNLELAEFMIMQQDFDPTKKFYYEKVEYPTFYDFASQKEFNNDVSSYLQSVREDNQKFIQAFKGGNKSAVIEVFSHQRILKKNLDSALFRCATSGDLELFRTLATSNRFDESIVDKDGHNLLHIAAASGNVEFVDYLLTDRKMSFLEEDKGKIFDTILKECPKEKRHDILSYLLSRDIGFLFANDFDKLPSANKENSYRLKDCHLAEQDSETVKLITNAQNKVIKIALDLENLSTPSQQQIIDEFESLKTLTQNPYSAVKYLYKTQTIYPEDQYYQLITTLTKHNAQDLYSKIATHEPELRFDHENNAIAFFSASSSITIATGYTPNLVRAPTLIVTEKIAGNNVDFFEFAASNFGNSGSVIQANLATSDSSSKQYLKTLANSDKIPQARKYSDDEVAYCITPQDRGFNRWNSNDPQIFYSFQVPKDSSHTISFTQEEQDFFNSVIDKSAKDIIVPVKQITLSEVELENINHLDKNILFIVKSQQPLLYDHGIHHVAYFNTMRDTYKPSYISHKVIEMPAEELNSEYMALHQIAIGVADLKHPTSYHNEISDPNCDHSITTDHTVMSHICGIDAVSVNCFNDPNSIQTGTKGFNGEIGFRNADIKAMTQSLLKQFPQLAENYRNPLLAGDREVKPYQEYGAGKQITLTHFVTAIIVLKIANEILKMLRGKTVDRTSKKEAHNPTQESQQQIDNISKPAATTIAKNTNTLTKKSEQRVGRSSTEINGGSNER